VQSLAYAPLTPNEFGEAYVRNAIAAYERNSSLPGSPTTPEPAPVDPEPAPVDPEPAPVDPEPALDESPVADSSDESPLADSGDETPLADSGDETPPPTTPPADSGDGG
jgi:hypothetical protein